MGLKMKKMNKKNFFECRIWAYLGNLHYICKLKTNIRVSQPPA